MFKIIDKRDAPKQECPTKLPFVTILEEESYLYYLDVGTSIGCICLRNGAKQAQVFHSIAEAVGNFNIDEKIVEVEIHIIK